MIVLVRSLECPQCLAPEGKACTLANADHLARWIAAWQAGLIERRALADVIAEMTVIAWQAEVPSDGRERQAA